MPCLQLRPSSAKHKRRTKRRQVSLSLHRHICSGHQQENRLLQYAFRKPRPLVSLCCLDAATNVALNVVLALLVSKEGSAQVKLKLGLVGDDAGHTFQFTGPGTAVAEREAFKTELTNIIANNRNGGATVDFAVNHKNPSPRTATPLLSVPASRAGSVSSNGRASSSAPSGPADDFHTRKNVLLKNQELADLHKQLVMTGQITENEFWEGREVLFPCHRVSCYSYALIYLSSSICYLLKLHRVLSKGEDQANWSTHVLKLPLAEISK